jgi:pyruvate carboxylase
VLPTRYFLAKPAIGEELSIAIEKGKTLTIKLLAVGPVNPDKGTRECFFELNGEVGETSYVYRRHTDLGLQSRAVVIEDRNAAIEHVSREKATADPGSVGSPMVSRLSWRIGAVADIPLVWCCH